MTTKDLSFLVFNAVMEAEAREARKKMEEEGLKTTAYGRVYYVNSDIVNGKILTWDEAEEANKWGE